MRLTWQRTVIAVAVHILVTPALAEEREDLTEEQRLARISALSDAEIDARLDYLIERLDYKADYAAYWWRGWTGFYALGVVFQGVRAGLENDDSSQADLALSAGKAVLGTFTLLRHPMAWDHGADSVRAMPNETREDRVARLAFAENKLHRFARVTDRRLNWMSHAQNVAINAACAGLVHGVWDDPSRAWRSAGIAIVIGEIMLFSHPWWPRKDYDAYEQRFGMASEPKVSWQIVPTYHGVAVHARF